MRTPREESLATEAHDPLQKEALVPAASPGAGSRSETSPGAPADRRPRQPRRGGPVPAYAPGVRPGVPSAANLSQTAPNFPFVRGHAALVMCRKDNISSRRGSVVLGCRVFGVLQVCQAGHAVTLRVYGFVFEVSGTARPGLHGLRPPAR